MAIEIIGAGRKTGAERLVVRGSGFLPLDRAAALRERYNEYPERYPLEPNFPQAGRRGGSRAPTSTSGAPASGASEGGGTPGEIIAPPPGLFPPPRERVDSALDGSISGQLPAGSSLPGCGITRGGMWRSSPQVGAGATVVEVSAPIQRPFKLIHLSYWSENTTPTGANMSLSLFLSNSTSLVAAQPDLGTEIPFIHDFGGATPFSETQHHYPNWVVSEVPQRIKVRWINASGGALETYFIADWEYLD